MVQHFSGTKLNILEVIHEVILMQNSEKVNDHKQQKVFRDISRKYSGRSPP